MRIFKYALPPMGRAVVRLPGDAPRPLAVDFQADDQLVLWAEVDSKSDAVKDYTFVVAMTGDDVPTDAEYVGSAQMTPLGFTLPHIVHVYWRRA